MQVQCPRCQTKYNLDASLLSPGGSPVRCSRCGHEFTARPQAEPKSPPPPAPQPSPPPDDDLMDFLEDDGKPIQGLEMDDDEGGAKKGSLFKKILIYLIILIVLLGLILGGVLFLKTRGTHLDKDYLGIDLYDYLTFLRPQAPEPEKGPEQGTEEAQDPGNKRIHLAGVEGSFLELEDQRQIFIIKGQVKNSYGHPREGDQAQGHPPHQGPAQRRRIHRLHGSYVER